MENLYGVMKGLMSEEFIELGQEGMEALYQADPDYKGLMEDTTRLSLMTLEVSLKPEVAALQRQIYQHYPTAALQATLAMLPMAELSIPATRTMLGDEAADLTERGLKNQREQITGILRERGAEIPPEVDLDAIEAVNPFDGFMQSTLDDEGYPETDCTIDYE